MSCSRCRRWPISHSLERRRTGRDRPRYGCPTNERLETASQPILFFQLPSYRDGSEGLHVANGDLVIRGFHEAGEANSFDTEEQLQRPIEGEGQEQR